jgi:asparagine synthase (glutamine-hydrolysing)
MLERVNGMFAIAIFDLKLKKLFLARDRFGIKPLYVNVLNDSLAFSSEIKSFNALNDNRLQLDERGIDEFLLFRNLINRTLFRNVENIPPGSIWTVDRNLDVLKTKFFTIESFNTRPIAIDPIDQIEASLRTAVKSQLAADVIVGSQLSGGVDSSLVTLFALESQADSELMAVSVIPDDPGYSEERWIDAASMRAGLNALKFPLRADYFLTKFDRAVWYFENPLNHPNTIGIFLLAEHAKQYMTVLLSGEGADEILGGYERFLGSVSLTSGLMSSLRILKNSFSPRRLKSIRLAFGDNALIFGSAFASIRDLIRIRPDFNFEQAMNSRREIWESLTGDTFLRHRKFEISTYLPDLLMRQDKMCMAHSIENRVPFLDNDFVELAMSLPAVAVMRHEGTAKTKHILKRIAQRHFGKEFSFRPKMGFGIPVRKFIDNPLFRERWFSEWSPRIDERGIFQVESMDRWVSNTNHASNQQLELIWQMAGFESWANQFL